MGVVEEPEDEAVPEEKPGRVFVSYSHMDKAWLEKLKIMYKPLPWGKDATVWDDTLIQPGGEWEKAIGDSLAAAEVAVLLVSPNFLASDFIREKELPRILDAARRKQILVLWVLLAASFYEAVGLQIYQAAHDIKRPLETLGRAQRNKALFEICENISRALGTDKALR